MAKTYEILPIEESLRKWAIISIDRFQAELARLDIGKEEGDLMRSFMYEVKANGGDAWTVLIKFLKYGRFVDMGVGKGHPLGMRNVGAKSANGNRYGKSQHFRYPKHWYSKIKPREVSIMKWIAARAYCTMTLRALETDLKSINQ